MKRLVAVLSVSLLVLSVAIAGVHTNKSKAYGKPLGEWMELYWTWFLGGDQDDHVGHVVFLPIPPGEPSPDDPTLLVGEADVTLKVGQPFVLPMLVWVGETYLEDIPDDDPNDFPAEIFTSARVVITLDGKVIINSAAGDLPKLFFDAQYFDETIFYDDPIEYAPDVHAIGAIWVKGIGFVHTPLSKGDHVLHLFVYVDSFGIGFENTWNITVQKK